MDYLLLAAAAVLLAFDFCCNKLYQQKAGSGMEAGLRYNMFVGLLTGVIFTGIHFLTGEEGKIFTGYSLILASALAFFGAAYLLIGFRMLKAGMMASYTLFLMTGGMTLPYIWGIFALDEEVSGLRISGLLLIFGGVFCANFKKEKSSAKYLGMGILVFFLNGMVSIVSKIHQVEQVRETVTSASFVLLSGLVKAVVCAVILAVLHFGAKQKADRKDDAHFSWKVIAVMAASALIGGMSYLFQLVGAKNLPATVLYPIITGGAIVGTAAAGRIFFKERIEKMTVIGIILCFAGTCCFL